MQIKLNGQCKIVSANLGLSELVAELKLTPEHVAAEVNEKIIKQTEWESFKLQPEDQVELVAFVGGG